MLATGLDRDIAYRDLSKSYDPEKTGPPRYQHKPIAQIGQDSDSQAPVNRIRERYLGSWHTNGVIAARSDFRTTKPHPK